ncbi:MAG: hypothetical protein EP330_26220 [Deltaproteobacteria bacterium]|nr:MAG: hypothetical protein EP330_26220 [Deltaproteobacteria bacterium]
MAHAHAVRSQPREVASPANAATSEAPAQEGTPAWASELQGSHGNARVLELVTGESMGEDQATALLDNCQEHESEASTETEAPVPELPTATPAKRPSGQLGSVFDSHAQKLPGMRLSPSGEHAWSINHFKKTFAANQGRYEAVAAQTGIPARLIAALHFRESSMRFDTYLHQGDPLGKPAVNHPANIPVFHVWEDAAVHALTGKSSVRDAVGMDASTTDETAIATFAERYNGLGYHYKNKPSPYVYAGTDVYRGGKYVRDGVYDPNVWDRQPGVMAMLRSLDEEMGPASAPQTPDEAWQGVAAGNLVIRKGMRGAVVEALQQRLVDAGHALQVDGDFGAKTLDALLSFQTAHGLTADGRVGAETAAALDAGGPDHCELPEGGVSAEDLGVAQPAQPAHPLADDPALKDAWQAVLDGGRLLKHGRRGNAVEALQVLLDAAGIDVGSFDGIFGRMTDAAVRAFQADHGLGVDGIVGPKTARALG